MAVRLALLMLLLSGGSGGDLSSGSARWAVVVVPWQRLILFLRLTNTTDETMHALKSDLIWKIQRNSRENIVLIILNEEEERSICGREQRPLAVPGPRNRIPQHKTAHSNSKSSISIQPNRWRLNCMQNNGSAPANRQCEMPQT